MTGLIPAVATFLAAVFLIPQIVRLLVRRDTTGVSTTWAGFGLVTNTAWVVYLSERAMWAPLMAPAIALVTYGITLAVVVRLDHSRRWVGHSCLYVLLLAATAPFGGVGALGLALALSPVIQVAPELAAVYRERHPSGVSPITWTLAGMEAILWGIYGWLVSDTALLGYGLVTCFASMLILGRWMATRPRWRVSTRMGI
jgi:uncharacterized protein with PQ loop repeat